MHCTIVARQTDVKDTAELDPIYVYIELDLKGPVKLGHI